MRPSNVSVIYCVIAGWVTGSAAQKPPPCKYDLEGNLQILPGGCVPLPCKYDLEGNLDRAIPQKHCPPPPPPPPSPPPPPIIVNPCWKVRDVDNPTHPAPAQANPRLTLWPQPSHAPWPQRLPHHNPPTLQP